ncbi:SIR2 family protein [Bradyrhizobium japonicum]
MPTALDITIVETLALLDGDFAEFAAGIAHDQYAIWLGAGVSLGKLPGLEGVAGEVLEHLRIRIDSTNAACKFRRSLDRILNLILSPEDWKEIDYAKSATDWKIFGRIREFDRRLFANARPASAGRIARLSCLGRGKVVERYGDPSITPGPEHFGLAALIAEGVASDVASANWDALIEKAIVAIAGSPVGLLQVRILPEDVRDSSARARFYKFHGCAVLGGEDEARYRERIVGRASQIHGWADKAENKVIAGKLLDLAISKSTLMLGLSAQDTNIQNIFVVAQQSLPASFPTHPPAVVLSEIPSGLISSVFCRISIRQTMLRSPRKSKSRPCSGPTVDHRCQPSGYMSSARSSKHSLKDQHPG